jgi:hypothetical protein
MSLCVVDYLSGRVRNKAVWPAAEVLQYKDGIVEACAVHVALYLEEVLKIMAGAFKADGGAMYRWGGLSRGRVGVGALAGLRLGGGASAPSRCAESRNSSAQGGKRPRHTKRC